MGYVLRATAEPERRFMDRKRAFIRIFVIIFSAASLAVSSYLSVPAGHPAAFTWIPEKKGQTTAEVIIGSALVVPFEFLVDPGIPRIRIEIEGEEMKEMGVFLSDPAVTVENGKAYAKAYFTLGKDVPPRSYTLGIIARDAATEKVIGKGSIPFAVYPSFYHALNCSC